MSPAFPDPPTAATLADARRSLLHTRTAVSELTLSIDHAEAVLAHIVRDSRSAIDELHSRRAALEQNVLKTMAYLSPIRRLPIELLRDIFMWNFKEYPCCAWVLSAVCSSWRRLALGMPIIWSKIRLITTQHASADTVRLWLERSGDSVPLDIEIFLRVTNTEHTSSKTPSGRRRRSSTPSSPGSPTWTLPFSHPHAVSSHYVLPQNLPGLTPTHSLIVPSSPIHDAWLSPPASANDRTSPTTSKTSMHWGHIAIYYLVEQMHRWERFLFRFDKQFTSMGALKSITGDAPLLKEFEVSSAEPAFYPEWPWLPNASPTTPLELPKLKSLTLQYTPFKWSSPMLRSNLHTLTLRALPTSHLPLDRILYIISSNPTLKNLSLHFQGVLPAILPLTPTALPLLTSFSIGGNHLLTQLADSLVLPNLNTLALDIEARDPIEDTICNLLTRSNSPTLTHLSISYGAGTASSFYYGPGGVVISWSVLLQNLVHLKSLYIGGTPLEPLLVALGPPDDEANPVSAWACPGLETLGMRNCHAHSEGVAKLVQMVEARNPGSGGGSGSSAIVGGVAPIKLKTLELYDCASLGQDVVMWLQKRIQEVVCTEPAYERATLMHPYL